MPKTACPRCGSKLAVISASTGIFKCPKCKLTIDNREIK